MHDGRLGPLIIDSLDKQNAPNQAMPQKTTYTKKTDTTVLITLITIIASFFAALIIFAYYHLSIEAMQYGNQIAYYLIWVLYTIPVVILTGLAVSFTIAAHRWLQGWSQKNTLVSLNDGPHMRAGDIQFNAQHYENLFALFAQRMYDIGTESAKQSQYRGVQTLTLDQSTSTSSTTQAALDAAQAKQNEDMDSTLYFNVGLLDAINK